MINIEFLRHFMGIVQNFTNTQQTFTCSWSTIKTPERTNWRKYFTLLFSVPIAADFEPRLFLRNVRS